MAVDIPKINLTKLLLFGFFFGFFDNDFIGIQLEICEN